MKNKIFAFLLLVSLMLPYYSSTADENKISKHLVTKDEIVPGEIIVKYKIDKINLKQTSGKKSAKQLESKYKFQIKDEVKDFNVQLIKTDQEVKETISNLKKDSNIEYAEPNFKKFKFAASNDSLFNQQWALQNTGQAIPNSSGSGTTSGTPNVDIKAVTAWDLESQSQADVIVADIDTGADLTHQDLTYNLWNGSSCVNENNAPISGGCPNHGWNFADNNNDPQDLDGHGTFIAGIISAQSNNNSLFTSMSYYNHIKLMPIKFGLDLASELKAISFAKNNGAKIINASFGGYQYSQAEHDAISSFGGIFVASAGNGDSNGNGINNDNSPVYPASYDNANIISVAATDQNDQLASFSNYGMSSVDIAAPGENILSTDLSLINKFSENFDSTTIPSAPSTLSNTTSNWITGSWSGTPNDHYIAPGEAYNPNTIAILALSQPIDTNTAEKLRLQFYINANIEYDPACALDSLEIQTDNNDNNWVTREKLCGAYGENVNFDLTSAKSSSMRIRFVWTANSSNNPGLFYNDGQGPTTPHLDDISLDFINKNSSVIAVGDGTSFSAPYVSGAAAMIESKFPGLTASQVKNQILNTADAIPSLSGKILSGARLNLASAIQSVKAPSPVFRFWSNTKQHHFFTIWEDEKNYVIAHYPVNVWQYEGIGFYAYPTAQPNTTPVYRFWSETKQGHFFTASEDEKNHVIAHYPDNVWHYEGIGFYAYPTAQPNTTPVYRFWSETKQGHFYTASEDEKNYVIAHYPINVWQYEGIAYYVPIN